MVMVKNSSRPLIVGLENPVFRTITLKSSRKLADTKFKDVIIIPDLTKQQRQEDEDEYFAIQKMWSELERTLTSCGRRSDHEAEKEL